MIDQPDKRTVIGRINVDLWKGLLRDEVRVWVDVRPALGGLLGRRTCWRGGGAVVYAEVVKKVREEALS